ncbi:MAG: hypothetical protein NZM35_03000 [Chitinophagales bacterium]|nr:hypothetical protein [Chitinophagales bacterium]MDW8418308.1 hypothetical protein [Chitinophagales bacterium]
MEWLRKIYYFFPVQLVLLSLKRHQFLLFFWVFILYIMIGKKGNTIGAPEVLLDPEYLGEVGYLSFSIVGMGFGALYVTWNLVMYILHSHRFPFMASLQYPLGMFFLNNSLIPLAVGISYIVCVIRFQTQYEFQTWWELLIEICGFIAGISLVVLITAVFFSFTNKNAQSYISPERAQLRKLRSMRKFQFSETLEPAMSNRVDYYLTNRFKIRATRSVEHYDLSLHKLVFRWHHFNAFMAFILALAVLLISGFFIENPLFQIPMAASSLVFFSLLMSLAGMFLYWTGSWGSLALIVFVIVANYLTKFDVFGSESRVFGLDYDKPPVAYNLSVFRQMASSRNIEADKRYFREILENWLHKNIDPRDPFRKPKLVFINVSGGGLRSGYFATLILQKADSILNGKLFDKTFLMSGASGGMFGLTYLREKFLEKKNGYPVNMQDPEFAANIGKDLLNPIGLSILSNDALLPLHKVNINGKVYYRDRGYAFEKYYCYNTGFPFQKTIGDYRQDEYDQKIPLLIYYTTVLNDSRRFYITPHPVSFLMRYPNTDSVDAELDIDAIDFCRMFKNHSGEQLLVTSAMRMDATFPLVFPNPVLPTEPPTYVMDGGALDNFGIETTLRFIQTFKYWINTYTDGVVILQIRDTEKFDEPKETRQKTVFSRLTDPIGTVYRNLENMQDFLTDQRLSDLDHELRGKINLVLFEYIPEKEDKKAAMSMHLTTRDKNELLQSVYRPNNQRAFAKLKGLLAR